MAAEEIAPRSRFRWKIGLAIPMIAGLITVASETYYRGDLTMQVMWRYYVWPATAFLTLLWWTFLSGLPWKSRFTGLATLALAAGTHVALRRFDGFDGAMRPKFSWRWMADEPDAAYWASLDDGERSAESLAMKKRLERESKKYAANGQSRSAPTIPLASYTPADTLRLIGNAGWMRWKDEDGLAVAVGIAPRLVFKESASQRATGNWPCLRGPLRDGVVRDSSGIRLDWTDANPPPNLWSAGQKIGKGWGSFAVVDGLAITLEQRGDTETVVCYDFATGTQVWTHGDPAHFKEAMGGNGPRTTPTVAGRRVYTLGAKGMLNCLDVVSGKPYWSTNILTDAGAKNLMWGMSGSPLVAGNLVIVNPGNGNNKAVIAYDRFTGKIVWATGNEVASYCSPTIHRIHGVPQLLIFGGEGLYAYDPNTGRELWRYGPFTNDPKVNVALPIVHGNEVLISGGYRTGSALLRINLAGGKWSAEQVWRKRGFFKLKFNDAIYKDGYVYGLDETILTCIEFKTGKRMWRTRGDFGYGQMLLVRDTLVITGESGRVSCVKASPQRHGSYPSFQALDRGTGWNHPVINRGRLLIRNNRYVACYDLTGS